MALLATLCTAAAPAAHAREDSQIPAPPQATADPKDGDSLPLAKCLEIALQKSRRRTASQFSIAMAEAQHRQALSAYWPQVTGTAGVQRMDQSVNFLFPSSPIPVPGQSIVVPGSSMLVTVPANAFAPGFPPTTLQLPVSFPEQKFSTSAQTFHVPEQDIKVIDRDLALGKVDLQWLLFDGGMRRGYREQASGQTAMMRQEARRTDLEIADSVKRMYWDAVLAKNLHRLGLDTLARLELTLRLTESLYKEGSGQVTKADYLDNSVIVESVRSMVAQLEKNEKMAQAALANTMGLGWQTSIRPADQEIPFEPHPGSLEELVGDSYRFNPDWGKLEAALQALEGAVRTARSGYYPKIAITGELRRWWNGGFNAGTATAQNRTGWSAGVGLEVPLFNGFMTQAKVAEAQARLRRLKETQFLLREGLGLQVKDAVLGLDAAAKTEAATRKALQAARENQELNTRAYESGLVETEKVIRAQLIESLTTAQHHLARYQYVELLSKLNLVVGKEVQAKLAAQP
ncbi:MAG: TolC family protein [Bryobacterales bacterium]|nr:TolC family protein [Bryobacterales bacterium]